MLVTRVRVTYQYYHTAVLGPRMAAIDARLRRPEADDSGSCYVVTMVTWAIVPARHLENGGGG